MGLPDKLKQEEDMGSKDTKGEVILSLGFCDSTGQPWKGLCYWHGC